MARCKRIDGTDRPDTVQRVPQDRTARLPDNVRVGPHTYNVVTGNAAELDAREVCGSVYGFCDPRTCTVFVSARQATTQAQDTLLHEVLHAVLDLTGHAHELEDEDEETLVRRLAPVLLMVLRDNPDLVRFLVAT